jgi:hypothetical protein
MVFDPNFSLSHMGSGFGIFALEDSLNEIPRRCEIPGQDPSLMTIFLHARVFRAGEFDPSIDVMINTETDVAHDSDILSMTFDRPEIPLTFSSALLGGLLIILQNTQRNVPLLICSSSECLSRALVKEREKFESDMIDPSSLESRIRYVM